MKKISFLFMLLFAAFAVNADLRLDFEDDGGFPGYGFGDDPEIVDNPAKGGLNETNKVAKWIRDKDNVGDGFGIWGLGDDSGDYSEMRFLIYHDVADDLTIHILDDNGDLGTYPIPKGVWSEITVPIPTGGFAGLPIFKPADGRNDGVDGETFYIDEIGFYGLVDGGGDDGGDGGSTPLPSEIMKRDFEDDEIDDGANFFAWDGSASVAANPAKGGLNTTDQAMKWARVASEQWAGFGTWALDGSANYEEMKFLVYQDVEDDLRVLVLHDTESDGDDVELGWYDMPKGVWTEVVVPIPAGGLKMNVVFKAAAGTDAAGDFYIDEIGFYGLVDDGSGDDGDDEEESIVRRSFEGSDGDNVNFFGYGDDPTVEDNPLKDAVNGTDRVLKWVRAAGNVDDGLGTWELTGSEGYNEMRFLIYQDLADGLNVRIEHDGGEIGVYPMPAKGSWGVVAVPIPAGGLQMNVSFQPAIGEDLAGDFYFDEFSFHMEVTPVATDFSALTAAITEAEGVLVAAGQEGLKNGDVVVGATATFQTAINAAKAVAGNTEATQAQVDGAIAPLAAAVEAFEAAIVVVNYGALNTAITAADAIKNAADYATKYDEASRTAFQAALTAAKTASAKTDATQAEVDGVKGALETAQAGLTLVVIGIDNATIGITIANGLILLGEVAEVQVYSVSGTLVLSTYDEIVDISGLAAGAYIVKAGSEVVKFVK